MTDNKNNTKAITQSTNTQPPKTVNHKNIYIIITMVIALIGASTLYLKQKIDRQNLIMKQKLQKIFVLQNTSTQKNISDIETYANQLDKKVSEINDKCEHAVKV